MLKQPLTTQSSLNQHGLVSVCLSDCMLVSQTHAPHYPALPCLRAGQNQHSALTLSAWLQSVERWSMCSCQRLQASRGMGGKGEGKRRDHCLWSLAFLIGSYLPSRCVGVRSFKVSLKMNKIETNYIWVTGTRDSFLELLKQLILKRLVMCVTELERQHNYCFPYWHYPSIWI